MMAAKILVAEDESDLLRILLLRLTKTGYEVFGAKDGREAFEKAKQMVPDMMIFDVFLPWMNGDSVVKMLKRDKRLAQIPAILISADTRNLERRARECGADGYLAKPFESQALIDLIRRNGLPS